MAQSRGAGRTRGPREGGPWPGALGLPPHRLPLRPRLTAAFRGPAVPVAAGPAGAQGPRGCGERAGPVPGPEGVREAEPLPHSRGAWSRPRWPGRGPGLAPAPPDLGSDAAYRGGRVDSARVIAAQGLTSHPGTLRIEPPGARGQGEARVWPPPAPSPGEGRGQPRVQVEPGHASLGAASVSFPPSSCAARDGKR